MTAEDPTDRPALDPVEAPPPSSPPSRRLLRSSSDRMITGLAGGIARHFDLDTTIVRAAFVVLAIFNGLGIVVYVVGSIIVPSDDAPEGARTRRDYGEWGRVASVVFGLLLVGLGAGALLANVRGLSVDWVAVACGALVVVGALLLLSGGRLARGPLVALGIILTVGLAPLTLANVSVTGSSFGDRVERPTSVADLQDYEHSFGSMTIDLRNLTLPEGTTTVRAQTAFGSLQMRVPRDVALEVHAEASFGSVQALGENLSGGPLNVDRTFRTADYDRASRRLSLEVESAFGSVEVLR